MILICSRVDWHYYVAFTWKQRLLWKSKMARKGMTMIRAST